MPARNDFLNQPAPENYVAGLGRGATGFTTRSDLGPAREGPSEDQIKEALAKRAAQLGSGGTFGQDEKKPEENDNEERYQDPENEVGLFANGAYDRDDDEADRIYQDVDERMEKRRRERRLVCSFVRSLLIHAPSHLSIHSQNPSCYTCQTHRQACVQITDIIYREAREQKEREEYERNNPKIQQQFVDLKRALGTVSDEDWASIPEVGDLTGKNKRVKRDNQANRRFYAVPDSVIAGANASNEYENSISEDGTQTQVNGANGDSTDGAQTNFADIGRARDKVLQVHLDKAAGTETSLGTSTSVDTKGYLTSLNNSAQLPGEAQIGDIKRARSLLESVTKTNPKHAPGWIAAARLESIAGKQVAARNKIAEGCRNCPNSEDAWIENIQLNENANARIIAAEALKRNDRSTRLWIQAMELESEMRAKKRVMRQALDHVPTSVALWKAAVNLEESESDARLMLSKATSLIPLSVELWLALARLESPENAQKVLNAARKAVPTSYEIWIAAARLQEQMGQADAVGRTMKRGIKALTKESAMLKRDEWIAEAEKCEDEGAIKTCAALINETLGYDLEEDEDRKNLFKDDAATVLARGHVDTARAIYDYAIRIFPASANLWNAFADLEREHGTKDGLLTVLEKATQSCERNAPLWMQLAREKWAVNMDEGRAVLSTAFNKNTGSEEIWLAAVGLESEHHCYDRARDLLSVAREQAGTDRVWIKSVALERTQGNRDIALNLVQDGLARYPKAAKLHMMKGQIYQSDQDTPQITPAREAYSAGTRACPHSAALWILAARLEESQKLTVKGRSILERARIANPHDSSIWVESIRLERRADNAPAAQTLMSRAIQEVPPQASGPLWAERIWYMCPRKERKALALEAVKKADNDPVTFICVARIFWSERRLEKASTWFEKALVLDADWGDAWGWYLRFLREHGTSEKRAEVKEKCVLVAPKHGEIWASVRKNPKNHEMTVAQILENVADLVE